MASWWQKTTKVESALNSRQQEKYGLIMLNEASHSKKIKTIFNSQEFLKNGKPHCKSKSAISAGVEITYLTKIH